LRPGELLVIHGDSTLSSSAVDPLSTEFAVVHADDDGFLDVILTSARADHGGRLLGNGDGSFASAVGLVMPALTQPHAINWLNAGSPQQLVAPAPADHPAQLPRRLADERPSVAPPPRR